MDIAIFDAVDIVVTRSFFRKASSDNDKDVCKKDWVTKKNSGHSKSRECSKSAIVEEKRVSCGARNGVPTGCVCRIPAKTPAFAN